MYPVPLEQPCDHLPWPKQLFCFLSHARTTISPGIAAAAERLLNTTGLSGIGTKDASIGAEDVNQMVLKDGICKEKCIHFEDLCKDYAKIFKFNV